MKTNNWQKKITPGRQRLIIENIAAKEGFSELAIEKDWWVTMTLKALFETSCANYLVFKGGTSLSKGWGLINRFSEDIDLAISKEFFGFTGTLGKSKLDKLRRNSFEYVQNALYNELDVKLKEAGISGYTIEVEPAPITSPDKDPRVIYVKYQSLFPKNEYLISQVKIEIGCRSLREPFEPRMIRSIIADYYPEEDFSDKLFPVNTVSPKRTFLEKAFLLHEALQKGRIYTDRMTRHLYDLEKLMDTDFASSALSDKELYKTIVQHRFNTTREKGVDYSTLCPSKIDFYPSVELIPAWRADYKSIQDIYINEVALDFDVLLERIRELIKRFRSIEMDETFFDSFK